jgi:hypothetical protein
MVRQAATGAGAAFVQSFEVCVAQIERNPELWPRAHGETRRGRLRRFPYVLYCELHGDDILIAAWHGRRDPHALARALVAAAVLHRNSAPT